MCVLATTKRFFVRHSLRNRRIPILIAVVLTITVGMVHASQGAEKVVRLVTLDVSDNLYLLRGNDTNILALVAETGIVLVDTLGQGWGPAIRSALNNITALPVTTIINTHAHESHSGGNLEFQSVVEILAHENTKSQMERMEIFQGPRHFVKAGHYLMTLIVSNCTISAWRTQMAM